MVDADGALVAADVLKCAGACAVRCCLRGAGLQLGVELPAMAGIHRKIAGLQWLERIAPVVRGLDDGTGMCAHDGLTINPGGGSGQWCTWTYRS